MFKKNNITLLVEAIEQTKTGGLKQTIQNKIEKYIAITQGNTISGITWLAVGKDLMSLIKKIKKNTQNYITPEQLFVKNYFLAKIQRLSLLVRNKIENFKNYPRFDDKRLNDASYVQTVYNGLQYCALCCENYYVIKPRLRQHGKKHCEGLYNKTTLIVIDLLNWGKQNAKAYEILKDFVEKKCSPSAGYYFCDAIIRLGKNQGCWDETDSNPYKKDFVQKREFYVGCGLSPKAQDKPKKPVPVLLSKKKITTKKTKKKPAPKKRAKKKVQTQPVINERKRKRNGNSNDNGVPLKKRKVSNRENEQKVTDMQTIYNEQQKFINTLGNIINWQKRVINWLGSQQNRNLASNIPNNPAGFFPPLQPQSSVSDQSSNNTLEIKLPKNLPKLTELY